MLKNIILGIGAVTVLAACSNTRDPAPISMRHSNDAELSCKQIEAEYEANTISAAGKIKKNNSDDGKDFALGLLVWPGLADFKNADGIEGNALLDRNAYLKQLAKNEGCEMIAWTEQPKRYN